MKALVTFENILNFYEHFFTLRSFFIKCSGSFMNVENDIPIYKGSKFLKVLFEQPENFRPLRSITCREDMFVSPLGILIIC